MVAAFRAVFLHGSRCPDEGTESMNALTLVHVAISLIGIVSGLIVAAGLLSSKRMDAMTAIFLATTVLTSATGFLFPFHKLLPSHILGILSLIVLAIAIYARYSRHMAGGWRAGYVITAMIALYLNVFVLVVQSFQKVPALHTLAPTQTEGPFKLAQSVVLVIFVVVTILATRKFRLQVLSTA
jgi:hypothetical protein